MNKLYFENSYGDIRLVSENISTAEEALSEIRKFCEERNYEIYYVRSQYKDKTQSVMVIDVGSHTECFYLSEKDLI